MVLRSDTAREQYACTYDGDTTQGALLARQSGLLETGIPRKVLRARVRELYRWIMFRIILKLGTEMREGLRR